MHIAKERAILINIEVVNYLFSLVNSRKKPHLDLENYSEMYPEN